MFAWGIAAIAWGWSIRSPAAPGSPSKDRFQWRIAGPYPSNFLIIGAAKAGTTSLHSYLALHPQIHMSKHKELAFDDRLRWSKGLDWYKSHFDCPMRSMGNLAPIHDPSDAGGQTTGIKDVLGAPVDLHRTDRSDAIRIRRYGTYGPTRNRSNCQHPPTTPYHCSCYFAIVALSKIVPKENILMLALERLNTKPVETLQQVFRFLDVDDKFTCRISRGD